MLMRLRPSPRIPCRPIPSSTKSGGHKTGLKPRDEYNFFIPRNQRQLEYKSLLLAKHPDILLVTGPAGTSKTMGATLVGLEKLLKKEIKRMVITRPAVSADEDLGFLPGSLEDKMKPWLLPIFDTLDLYMTRDEIQILLQQQNIEICSLSHMRGRTFRDSFVIIDECQNTTPSQMLMLLTRIGENSKFVLTGDLQQHDQARISHPDSVSGLADFVRRYKSTREPRDFEGTRPDLITSFCIAISCTLILLLIFI